MSEHFEPCACGSFRLLTATGVRYVADDVDIIRHRRDACDRFVLARLAPAPSPLAPEAREPQPNAALNLSAGLNADGTALAPEAAPAPKCGVPLDVHPPLHAGYRWEHGNWVCREVPDPRTCVCGHVHPGATDEHNGECESPGCPCGVSSHAPLDVWQQVNCTPCRHWVGGRCAQRRLLTGAEGCPGFSERPRVARCDSTRGSLACDRPLGHGGNHSAWTKGEHGIYGHTNWEPDSAPEAAERPATERCACGHDLDEHDGGGPDDPHHPTCEHPRCRCNRDGGWRPAGRAGRGEGTP